MTTERRSARQLNAESMVFLKDASGWHLIVEKFGEAQKTRLKKIMDPDTDEVSLRRAIVEYEATRKVLDYPDQIINEKDLNDGR